MVCSSQHFRVIFEIDKMKSSIVLSFLLFFLLVVAVCCNCIDSIGVEDNMSGSESTIWRIKVSEDSANEGLDISVDVMGDITDDVCIPDCKNKECGLL